MSLAVWGQVTRTKTIRWGAGCSILLAGCPARPPAGKLGQDQRRDADGRGPVVTVQPSAPAAGSVEPDGFWGRLELRSGQSLAAGQPHVTTRGCGLSPGIAVACQGCFLHGRRSRAGRSLCAGTRGECGSHGGGGYPGAHGHAEAGTLPTHSASPAGSLWLLVDFTLGHLASVSSALPGNHTGQVAPRGILKPNQLP